MKLVNGRSWLINLDQDVTPAVPMKTMSSAWSKKSLANKYPVGDEIFDLKILGFPS